MVASNQSCKASEGQTSPQAEQPKLGLSLGAFYPYGELQSGCEEQLLAGHRALPRLWEGLVPRRQGSEEQLKGTSCVQQSAPSLLPHSNTRY